MWTSLALTLCALAAPSARAEEPAGAAIDLDERDALLMLGLAPNGATGGGRVSSLYRAADAALRARTTLALRTPEQAGLDPAEVAGCELEVRLTCLVSAVRSAAPAYLVIVSYYPLPDGSDRLTAIAIDYPSARRELERVDRSAEGWRVVLEEQLFRIAVHTRPELVRAAEPGSVELWFDRLVTEHLGPALSASGHDRPLGAIVVRGAPPGLSIELDGRSAGATVASETRLIGLRPGTRELSLSDPTGLTPRFVSRVTVEPGRSFELDASAVRATAGGRGDEVVLWGGSAVAAVGLAVVAVAIALAPEARTAGTCTGEGCAGSSRTFATFCELGAGDPTRCAGSLPLLAAPLGYSLALGGGAAALGAWWLGDDPLSPWAPIAVGLATVAAAYGVSAIAD